MQTDVTLAIYRSVWAENAPEAWFSFNSSFGVIHYMITNSLDTRMCVMCQRSPGRENREREATEHFWRGIVRLQVSLGRFLNTTGVQARLHHEIKVKIEP